MEHLRAVNQKAVRVRAYTEELPPAGPPPERRPPPGAVAEEASAALDALDVEGLESRPPEPPPGPHIPLGCSLVFAPGWEVDSSGGTAGLCQPVERDLFDCHLACFWPAQVPDQLNHAPDWTGKCASAQKDWRKIDLVFP